MFTGIVQEVGEIVGRSDLEQGVRLTVRAPKTAPALAVGDSVCTAGVCLTCVEKESERFSVDVSAETIRKSTIGERFVGAYVNLEPALRLSDRLGGHLVTGHVDGTGSLVDKKPEGASVLYTFSAPPEILRYTVEKGSIAVEGVSLTVFNVTEDTFQVALIPHTLEVTTLGLMDIGARVNLEIDLIAKYVEKLLGRTDSTSDLLALGGARSALSSADTVEEDR